ncbi:MAG: methionyl-tRNA formyltransferase [Cyclobacteriaceae bacterium]
MHDLRIIFMGTPEFAVPSLQILVENQLNVVAVITAPDKPKGRGRKVATSPVKDYAVQQGIPVLQPTNLKSETFQAELRSYEANLQVVVAFRMLPEAVWNMPAIGTFNLHASLLPQYRGAAPINWAIINGEKETGATTFFLKHEIDTGNIIFREKEPIHDDDTAGSLYGRLMHMGAKLVHKTVKAIEMGGYPQEPQTAEGELKAAPKIFKETCEIDWKRPASELYDFIRGLSPYPAAWTRVNDRQLKVFGAEVVPGNREGLEAGGYKTDGKSYLHFQTGKDVLSVTDLQIEGKKRMNIEDFLRGNTL